MTKPAACTSATPRGFHLRRQRPSLIDVTDGGCRCIQLRLCPKYGEGSRQVAVRYQSSGAPGDPVVLVQGGISADCRVSSTAGRAGWWADLVGTGKAIDLARYRVVSIDWIDAEALGSCSVSTEDQADALAGLLDALGIEQAHAFVGASYGAMVGLAFAARHASRLRQLVAIAGAHRPHPLATAQRVVQRRILELGLASGCEQQALELARQLAFTSYRGSRELARRFGGAAEYQDGRFRLPVEDWLTHVGRKGLEGFSARRYHALSESIDLHDINPSRIGVPATLIGFTSDRLVPLADLCELQRKLATAATLHAVESEYGHDGFLKESASLAPLLRDALEGVADSHRGNARSAA